MTIIISRSLIPSCCSTLASSSRLFTRSLASHAYMPPSPSPSSSSSPTSSLPIEATTTTPTDLTDEQRRLIDSIIRVDQAGELGANWIYRGQKWAMDVKGDKETAKQVEEMWENERHHLTILSHLQTQHRARPTMLYPLWQAMAFGLGASTGLLSKEAAMACTEAVETVIGEHYDDQLKALQPLLNPTDPSSPAPHPSLPLMADILKEFRDDELEHLDTAVEEGAQKAPGHSLLSAIIGVGCKVAIKVCEKV
ncbi:ubiquinone biosynthesis monooxygenase Coq7 [Kwoniella mangroviensis CBS 8886]|nr:ubiquinone biosynthesis monooxygenase Coq7 [Kwoniella mangroviensis CBS 8886]